ncbi:MAG: ATP-binding protein [Pseudomonadota bacterium]
MDKSTSILSYFYEVNNWLHLEERQKLIGTSPNILYSYITDPDGAIVLGTKGLDSPEIGQVKLPWEDLPVIARKANYTNRIKPQFEKIELKGEPIPSEIILVKKEIKCENQKRICGYISLGVYFKNAHQMLALIQKYSIIGSLSIAFLVGFFIYSIIGAAIYPISDLTNQMKLVASGSKSHSRIFIHKKRRYFENYYELIELEAAASVLQSNILLQEKFKVYEAISKTTQMLAHDIRKPFSMMQIMIKLLRSAKSFEASQTLLNRLGPDIDRAMATVNVMLSEVMEVGADTKLTKSLVDFGSLLDQSLNQVFSHGVNSDIDLEYQISLKRLLNVDAFKVIRVFTNLISNAADAMHWKGKILITGHELTQSHHDLKSDLNQSHAQIEFFNAGSSISEEDLPHIFEAFFTKGKDSGTGLGLAITRKIVRAHGGDISCSSIPNVGVKFTLTLPLAESATEKEVSLPQNSKWYCDKMAGLSVNQETIKPSLSSSEDLIKLTDLFLKRDKPIKILLIDDESLYRTSINHLIDNLGSAVSQMIEVKEVSDSTEADKELATSNYDLVITDIDLGLKSSDGYEIVRKYRALNPKKSFLCIHSNRISEMDSKKAYQSGAQAFVPKPMAKEHLIRLILEAMKEVAT